MENSPPVLRPLFTTTPLTRSSVPATSISPLDKRFGTVRPTTSGYAEIIDEMNTLCFDKIAIPRLTVNQEYIPKLPLDRLSCSPTAGDDTRSPSLISCLFQAGRSRHSSSSGSSQPTPLTPLSTSPTTQGCRSILFRPTPCSTSTSPSEDTGMSGSIPGGLGMTSSHKAIETAKGESKGCSIRFAVKPCSTATTGRFGNAECSARSMHSRTLQPSIRSSYFGSTWCDEIRRTKDIEESDDEGYQEDEEGGFSSDGEASGTSAGPSRIFRAYTARLPIIPRTAGDVEAESGYSSSGEDVPCVYRGRRVRIAAKAKDRCSRHRSPPPRTSMDFPPLAARSPSAVSLMQRRQARRIQTIGLPPLDNADPLEQRSKVTSPICDTDIHRGAQAACQPILRSAVATQRLDAARSTSMPFHATRLGTDQHDCKIDETHASGIALVSMGASESLRVLL